VSGDLRLAERVGLAVSLLLSLASAAAWLLGGNVTGGPLGVASSLVTAGSQVIWWAVGAVIILRAGRRRIGWILLTGATFGSIAMASIGILGPGLASGNLADSPAATWAFLAVTATYGPWFTALIVAGMLLFPDGQLPGARWRLPVALTLGVVGAGTLARLIMPGPLFPNLPDNPLGVTGLPREPLEVMGNLVPIGIVAAALLGAASMVVRFQRANRQVRHQLKWLLAAVLPAALSTPFAFTDNDQATTTVADLVQLTSLFVFMPASIAIAITRYRLYEIDRLVSRGLAWGLLTSALVAVYAGAVLVLQALLGSLTQGATLAIAASTLLAAALFQPLRRRIQTAVDRRFDRAGYDLDRVALAFAGRMRQQVDLGGLEADIAGTVRTALRPGSATLWVKVHVRPEAPR
jgi:hypothetical protein